MSRMKRPNEARETNSRKMGVVDEMDSCQGVRYIKDTEKETSL